MVLRLPGRTRLSRTPARFELFPIPREDPGAAFALSAIHHQLDVCSTVITVTEGDVIYGVNSWKSNDIDIRRYREDSS